MPRIHDMEVEQYLHESVTTDRTDINSEFTRVAGDLYYWGERYAQAEGALAEAKAEYDVVHAGLYQKYRSVLEARAAKAAETAKPKKAPLRVTDAQVESALLKSNEHTLAKQEVIDCETAKVRLRGIIEAVKTKRDMLVSLGAQMRAELRGEPHINSDEDDWNKTR